MFFPIRTDRRLKSIPWVNYSLIAVNLLIYLATRQHLESADDLQLRLLARAIPPEAVRDAVIEHYPVVGFYLFPPAPSLVQFISYQFLHASPMHIIGNMLFLYVFGNSVEDRLGKVGFLSFYLAGGVLAGLGHAISTEAPVLGASGAVAAVTGAYLALFPLSNVTMMYFIFFVGAFEISSLYLILFQIGHNVFMHLQGATGVAYMAHLSGYAYGFLIGIGLLWAHLLPREPYDLLALFEQHHRPGRFRRMVRAGYQPWQHKEPTSTQQHEQRPTVNSADAQRKRELRQRISGALSQQNLGTAADLYHQLLKIDADQVMSQQQQLDISNQLMSEGRYAAAAHAYELFLRKFGGYTQREQVELILGLIYFKYLDARDRGRELLSAALPRLHDEQQKQLAKRMLSEES